MRIGHLEAVAALDRPDLLAPAVATALATLDGKLPAADAVGVAEIDPDLADTAAFCERYGVALDESANCVVVAGSATARPGSRPAWCWPPPVPMSTGWPGAARRAQGLVRRGGRGRRRDRHGVRRHHPGRAARGWPVFVDAAVAAADQVIIGSGVRRSKLTLPGEALSRLPGAVIQDGLGR